MLALTKKAPLPSDRIRDDKLFTEVYLREENFLEITSLTLVPSGRIDL